MADQVAQTNQCVCTGELGEKDYSTAYAAYNFGVVIVALPLVALFGVLSNLVNFYVFTRRSKIGCSNSLYLAALALSDFAVVLTGTFIFCMDSIRSYIPQINIFATTFILWILPMGYIAQTGSVYFTVGAAFDCYMALCWHNKTFCTNKWASRYVIVVFIFTVGYNSLRRVNVVYNVYMYMLLMTFLPFILLSILNAFIVRRLQKKKILIGKREKLLRKIGMSAGKLKHNEPTERFFPHGLPTLNSWAVNQKAYRKSVSSYYSNRLALNSSNEPNHHSLSDHRYSNPYDCYSNPRDRFSARSTLIGPSIGNIWQPYVDPTSKILGQAVNFICDREPPSHLFTKDAQRGGDMVSIDRVNDTAVSNNPPSSPGKSGTCISRGKSGDNRLHSPPVRSDPPVMTADVHRLRNCGSTRDMFQFAALAGVNAQQAPSLGDHCNVDSDSGDQMLRTSIGASDLHVAIAGPFHHDLVHQLQSHDADDSPPEPSDQNSDETVTTMIVVVVLFLACNLLALVINVVETFFKPDRLLLNFLSDTSNFLVVFNSSVNFVIYRHFDKKFRKTFRKKIWLPLIGYVICKRVTEKRRNSVNFDLHGNHGSSVSANETVF